MFHSRNITDAAFSAHRTLSNGPHWDQLRNHAISVYGFVNVNVVSSVMP